jgi:hypothetical protein
MLKNYKPSFGKCPNDGEYKFTHYSEGCFNDNWHTVLEDHTLNDNSGKMMIVNASERLGIFFSITVVGLKSNTAYQLSCWLANICKSANGCVPTPPTITVSLLANGKKINSFLTGKILPDFYQVIWKNFSGEFILPANATSINIQMENTTRGGCGNDFALDDIWIKECAIKQPIINPQSKPDKPMINVEKPRPVEITLPTLKKLNEGAEKISFNPRLTPQEIKQVKAGIEPPKILTTRENPVVKKITTVEDELKIELYDNGDIDGDTVSIYHNNILVVNKAALSAKAVTYIIKVDKQNPHHELIMVANNLGSIPPNTSVMIVTTKKKRYEVFISASEQKNAKVVIDLE